MANNSASPSYSAFDDDTPPASTVPSPVATPAPNTSASYSAFDDDTPPAVPGRTTSLVGGATSTHPEPAASEGGDSDVSTPWDNDAQQQPPVQGSPFMTPQAWAQGMMTNAIQGFKLPPAGNERNPNEMLGNAAQGFGEMGAGLTKLSNQGVARVGTEMGDALNPHTPIKQMHTLAINTVTAQLFGSAAVQVPAFRKAVGVALGIPDTDIEYGEHEHGLFHGYGDTLSAATGTGAMVGSYYNDVKQIIDGWQHPEKYGAEPTNREEGMARAILNRVQKAPAETLMNYAGPAVINKVARVAGAYKVVGKFNRLAGTPKLAERLAGRGGVLAAGAIKARTLGKRLPYLSMMPGAPAWLKGLPEAGAIQQLLANILIKADKVRLDIFLSKCRKLDKAAADLPPDWTTTLSNIARGSVEDPAVMSDLAVHHYLDVVQETNEWVQKVFGIPEYIADTTQYGSMLQALIHREKIGRIRGLCTEYRQLTCKSHAHIPGQHARDIRLRQEGIAAEIKDLSVNVTAGDLYKPEYQAQIKQLKAALIARNKTPGVGGALNPGIHLPVYVPLRVGTPGLNGVFNPLGGPGTSFMPRLAAQVEKAGVSSPYELPAGTNLGQLNPRIAAIHKERLITTSKGKIRQGSVELNKHVHNINTAIKETVAEATTYMAACDAVYELLTSYPLGKDAATWETVNVLKEMTTLAERVEKGMGEGAVLHVQNTFAQRGLPTELRMPPKVARKFKELMRGRVAEPNILGVAGRLWAQWHFGLNLTFGAFLALRTAFIQLYIPRTPKDALALIVSQAVACHPEAWERTILSPAATLSHTRNPLWLDSAETKAGMTLFGRIVESKLGIDYAIHNPQRLGVMIWALLYDARGRSYSVIDCIHDVFHIEATLQKVAGRVLTPGAVKSAQRILTAYMGDYSAQAYNASRGLSQAFPTWAFVRHLGNMMKTVPFDNPFKTAFLSQAGSVASRLAPTDELDIAADRGWARQLDENGHPRVGPNGRPLYESAPDIGFASSAFEIVLTVLAASGARGAARPRIPCNANPVLNIWTAFFQGIEPISGKNWLDLNPDIVMNNKHYIWRDTGRLVGKPRKDGRPPNPRSEYVGPGLDALTVQYMHPPTFSAIQHAFMGNKSPSRYWGKPAPRREIENPPTAEQWAYGIGGVQSQEVW